MKLYRAQNTEGLTDIRIDYLREDFQEMNTELETILKSGLQKYFPEHLEHDFFAYLAEDNGKIIGSAFLVTKEMPPNPSFPHGKIGTVLNVFVDKTYRHKGIATGLLKLLISDAREMELDYIELKASDDGYPLYKKLGFIDSISSFSPMKLIL